MSASLRVPNLTSPSLFLCKRAKKPSLIVLYTNSSSPNNWQISLSCLKIRTPWLLPILPSHAVFSLSRISCSCTQDPRSTWGLLFIALCDLPRIHRRRASRPPLPPAPAPPPSNTAATNLLRLELPDRRCSSRQPLLPSNCRRHRAFLPPPPSSKTVGGQHCSHINPGNHRI